MQNLIINWVVRSKVIIIRIVRTDTVPCLGTTVHKLANLVELCGIDGCSMVAPVWAASRAMQDGTTSTGTPVLQYVSTCLGDGSHCIQYPSYT